MPRNESGKIEVTAYISTSGRIHTTLPLAITSICMQTYKPKELILYLDGERPDLRQDPMYQYLFGMLADKGIEWKVGFGEGKGQVLNHQKAIKEAKYEWLWRLDDDNIAEPDVLEKLVRNITDKTGAVAGLVLHPNRQILELPPSYSYNKIEYCEDPSQLNIQWFRQTGIKYPDHLYSTFIYRKAASDHGYRLDLSPVGHREESFFTYEMKRKGWDLIMDPEAVTWHFRYNTGGIRSASHHTKENFDHDADLFRKYLDECGVKLKTKKVIVLDNGLGDHLAFRRMLPEIYEEDMVIACCYPQVFKKFKVTIISIADAVRLYGNLERWHIYRHMWDRNWKTSIVDAYRDLYKK
jgi:hypothetical protein